MCLCPIEVAHPRYRSLNWRLSQLGLPCDWDEVQIAHAQRCASLEKSMNNGYVVPTLLVPCGRCEDCNRKRAHDWRTRLNLELAYGKHRNAIFVTLTVAPEHMYLFPDYSDKKAIGAILERFFDRWRKKFTRSKTPKHFIVTELGKKTGRFHFHGIIWDVPFYSPLRREINAVLSDLWQYGNTWVGDCDGRTYNYVVKYILKPIKGYRPLVFCSKKIGFGFLSSAERRELVRKCGIHKLCKVSIVGCRGVSLPRYLKFKCFTDEEIRDYQAYNAWCVVSFDYWDPPEYKGHKFNSYRDLYAYKAHLYECSLARGLSRPLPKASSGINYIVPNPDFDF